MFTQTGISNHMKKAVLLLSGIIACFSLTQCGGGNDDPQSRFSMKAKSFEKSRKQFIIKRAAGYVVVMPSTGGWYYTSLRPNTGNEFELGKATCECYLYYSPNDPYSLGSERMTVQAEYQDNADGTAVLSLAGNSNSDSLNAVANIVFVLLGLNNVQPQLNQALHVDITTIFTEEAAGTWSSNGSYVDKAGGISGSDATFGIISK